jgi:4-amino-4-deoxy-L-arabinose transferase-like glycosyltransferase
MTIEPTTEAVGRASPADEPQGPNPVRVRIRWGWFLGCIVLGLVAITVGWLLAAPADRLGYVGGVLGGIGTTLLLVGIVVLLERRIIDTAVRVVRDVAKEARAKADEEVRARVHDLETRVADIWETATPETATEETRRMIDEFTRGVVEVFSDDDQAPPRRWSR